MCGMPSRWRRAAKEWEQTNRTGLRSVKPSQLRALLEFGKQAGTVEDLVEALRRWLYRIAEEEAEAPQGNQGAVEVKGVDCLDARGGAAGGEGADNGVGDGVPAVARGHGGGRGDAGRNPAAAGMRVSGRGCAAGDRDADAGETEGMKMQTFAELKNRYVVECVLASEAALHVGSGESSSVADSAALRQAGRALIPGSSMRGALRALLERIVVSLGAPSDVKPCVLFAGPEALAGLGLQGVGCLSLDPDFHKLTAKEQEKKLFSDKPVLCDLCQLFGSTVMAGRLKTLDAVPAETVFTVRHGVGINRDTHTAQEHIKYEFEVAEKGPAYAFRMEIENATERDFALLHILLAEMKQGFSAGGKKNQGLGRLRLEGHTVKYFDPDSALDGYSLREFLRSRELKAATAEEFEVQLQIHFERYAGEVQ